MALNPFTIKKYAVLLIVPVLVTILFYVGLLYWGFLWAIVSLGIGLILGAVLGNALLKTPFSNMLEGKGLLCFNLDSTGVLQPFNVGLDRPYIKGRYNKTNIKDIFDRSTVLQLAPPRQAKNVTETETGNLIIELDTKNFNNARLALFHFPVLIWNDQLKCLLTKDDLMNNEKTAFAEHNILFLNKQVEDLNGHLLNFGRYIVESTKPIGNIFQNKWTWIIMVAILIIASIFIFPIGLEFFKGVAEKGGGAIAKTTGAITPA